MDILLFLAMLNFIYIILKNVVLLKVHCYNIYETRREYEIKRLYDKRCCSGL
jgi:hypothetical protein